MSNSRTLLSGLAVMLAIAIIPSTGLASHPNHVSKAEVNWNPQSGNFEVALCLWPTDLEKALGSDQSKTIDLDKVEKLDEMMKTYIEKRFLFRKSDSDDEKPTAKIRWVGHERDYKTAWLYFEVEGDKQGTQWTIENRVFFELNDDQLNQLQMTVGKKSTIVVCQPSESRFTLDTAIDRGH